MPTLVFPLFSSKSFYSLKKQFSLRYICVFKALAPTKLFNAYPLSRVEGSTQKGFNNMHPYFNRSKNTIRVQMQNPACKIELIISYSTALSHTAFTAVATGSCRSAVQWQPYWFLRTHPLFEFLLYSQSVRVGCRMEGCGRVGMSAIEKEFSRLRL